MRPFEFYYDFVCPYAFLASRMVDALATEHAGVVFRPILLGGVFRAIGGVDDPNLRRPAPKRAYGTRELERAASKAGVTLNPPANHPRRTVTALRAVIASADVPRATRALYEAYWLQARDLEDDIAVAEALTNAGFDGADLLVKASSQPIKDELRRRTDEAVGHGVFGVPTFRVPAPASAATPTGELVFGVDRIELLRAKLRAGRVLAFYFDYSSPFAYLGAMSVRALAARTGAVIDYRPILLGGLFKSIGTPNVPLLEMPAPKQRYLNEELHAAAARSGVPFRFTTRFPMNTVKALRLTLAAPSAARGDLCEALFRALWVEDRDVSDIGVLTEIAAACGVQRSLPGIDSPDVKTALFEATASAQARGVFGVPSFFVGEELYWGHDRMADVEHALLHDDVSSLAPV